MFKLFLGVVLGSPFLCCSCNSFLLLAHEGTHLQRNRQQGDDDDNLWSRDTSMLQQHAHSTPSPPPFPKKKKSHRCSLSKSDSLRTGRSSGFSLQAPGCFDGYVDYEHRTVGRGRGEGGGGGVQHSSWEGMVQISGHPSVASKITDYSAGCLQVQEHLTCFQQSLLCSRESG